MNDLTAEVLKQCEEYFDQRADVDDGMPNLEMKLLVLVRQALKIADTLPVSHPKAHR